MSYSFLVRKPTVAEARAEVERYFDEEVCARQPEHEHDKAAMLANVDAALALVEQDPSKDCSINVNGFLSWRFGSDGAKVFTSASVACSVAYIDPLG